MELKLDKADKTHSGIYTPSYLYVYISIHLKINHLLYESEAKDKVSICKIGLPSMHKRGV